MDVLPSSSGAQSGCAVLFHPAVSAVIGQIGTKALDDALTNWAVIKSATITIVGFIAMEKYQGEFIGTQFMMLIGL
jgi:hypothetical protein